MHLPHEGCHFLPNKSIKLNPSSGNHSWNTQDCPGEASGMQNQPRRPDPARCSPCIRLCWPWQPSGLPPNTRGYKHEGCPQNQWHPRSEAAAHRHRARAGRRAGEPPQATASLLPEALVQPPLQPPREGLRAWDPNPPAAAAPPQRRLPGSMARGSARPPSPGLCAAPGGRRLRPGLRGRARRGGVGAARRTGSCPPLAWARPQRRGAPVGGVQWRRPSPHSCLSRPNRGVSCGCCRSPLAHAVGLSWSQVGREREWWRPPCCEGRDHRSLEGKGMGSRGALQDVSELARPEGRGAH